MGKNRSISKDNQGQLSLDFLIGIGIFTTAILFVLTFIPGMFVPFISNSDDLTMTADRTAATIVDNTLAWVDADSNIHPGILDTSKISAFGASMNTPSGYETIRKNLGLKMTDSALYSLEIKISYENGTESKIFNSDDELTTIRGNVGQSKRFVLIRNPAEPSDYPGTMAIITVRVW